MTDRLAVTLTVPELEALLRRVVREEVASAGRTLYNIKDAALSLGVSEAQVARFVRERRLRRMPGMGRRFLIPADALAEFAARREAGQ